MDCVTRGHNNEIEKQTNYILDFKLFSNDLVAWLNEKRLFKLLMNTEF